MFGLGITAAIITSAAITIKCIPNRIYQNFIRQSPYSLIAKYSAMILRWRNDAEFAKEIVSTYPDSDAAIALYAAIQPNEIELEWTKNIIRYNEHGHLNAIWYQHSCALLDDQDFLVELILSEKRNKIPVPDSELRITQNLVLKAINDINFAKKIILDISADKALVAEFYTKYKKALLQDLDFSKKFLMLITGYGTGTNKTYKTIYDDVVSHNIFQLTTKDKTFAKKFVKYSIDSDGITNLLEMLGFDTQEIFEAIFSRYTDPFLVIKTSAQTEIVEVVPNIYILISFSKKAAARMWDDQKKLLVQNHDFLKQALEAKHFPPGACAEIRELAPPYKLEQVCDSLEQHTSCSRIACTDTNMDITGIDTDFTTSM